MDNVLGKVTAFITRNSGQDIELLLFEHPHAGIQIPGGTVELNESYESAVLRETFEETGLSNVTISSIIGHKDKVCESDNFIVLSKTEVYSRPDPNSFNWANFRRGIVVKKLREENSFIHASYTEYDKYPDHNYITYNITGWVPSNTLTKKKRRYFYHIECNEATPDSWEKITDNHNIKLFWAPISNLPEIVHPQNEWLEFVMEELNYKFE